jgi:streptomycin 6-kinase
MIETYLQRWNLVADGAPIVTRTSRLVPVRRAGAPAMLKLALDDEERRGGRRMIWWNGDGAARVLAHHRDAILLERPERTRTLAALSRGGRDDEASVIACDVVAGLHKSRAAPPADLVPLSEWFGELEPAAAARGGVLPDCLMAARRLLASPRDAVVLHGDIHHENILDFGPHGWLAIDPKGLVGERGFDYANLFCNPDQDIAAAPDRFARRLAIVSAAAALEPRRLLQWILAWAGLSAVISASFGDSPQDALDIAALAVAELAR